MAGVTLSSIAGHAEAAGLRFRGVFHPGSDEPPPYLADGKPAGTIVLLGFVGASGWAAFAASAERADGEPHPLDRWSQRTISAIASTFDATPAFPFEGPPYHPFQRWAMRAEPVHPSPLGILIHPEHGLWHSYRGALLLADRLALPDRVSTPSPCDACTARPCLSACPVGAFQPAGYAVDDCSAHLMSAAGADCMTFGCRARRACPVGVPYPEPMARFLMDAFVAARRA